MGNDKAPEFEMNVGVETSNPSRSPLQLELHLVERMLSHLPRFDLLINSLVDHQKDNNGKKSTLHTFKFKGNQMQYEFNLEIIERRQLQVKYTNYFTHQFSTGFRLPVFSSGHSLLRTHPACLMGKDYAKITGSDNEVIKGNLRRHIKFWEKSRLTLRF